MTAVGYSEALSSVARDELAPRRFGDFIELLEPSYVHARYTVAICDHLEAVEQGEINRLMIFIPPRLSREPFLAERIHEQLE
jgi:hypothetical protein